METSPLVVQDDDRGILYALRAYQGPGSPDDRVIYKAWAKCINRCPPFSAMTGGCFRDYVNTALPSLLQRATTLIAHNPDDVDQVFGFACGEHVGATPHLHMIYVRFPFRRLGISTRLMRHLFPGEFKKKRIALTHPTIAAKFYRQRWLLETKLCDSNA